MKVAVPAEVADVLRVEAVVATGLLDTGPEEPFERLVQMAARLADAPSAVITLADSRRSFLKAAVGMSGELAVRRQVPVEESICPHVIGSNGPVVVEEAAEPVLGARAWIAVPIRSGGQVVAT